MPRNKGGLWEAMKAGKFWHEPEPKPEPAPKQPKKTKPKSAMAKKILEAKAKKEKDFPNQENTQVKPSGKPQPGCTKRTNISPKKGNLASSEPEAEKKVDIPFNHPNRPSQTSIEGRGRKKAIPNGKVLDLDLWEGDTTEIYPKITVMPHGLRLIGTHEEFMRLANKLLSS